MPKPVIVKKLFLKTKNEVDNYLRINIVPKMFATTRDLSSLSSKSSSSKKNCQGLLNLCIASTTAGISRQKLFEFDK